MDDAGVVIANIEAWCHVVLPAGEAVSARRLENAPKGQKLYHTQLNS